MTKKEFIEKLLKIAYKNTLCLDDDFRVKNAKDMTLLFIKEKQIKLYTKSNIEYIKNYKFN